MKCGHVIDAGRHEEGNAGLRKIAAASKESTGKLPNPALNLCVSEGIVTFDQGNLVGPVAIQHVVHRAQSIFRQRQSTAKFGKKAGQRLWRRTINKPVGDTQSTHAAIWM